MLITLVNNVNPLSGGCNTTLLRFDGRSTAIRLLYSKGRYGQ